MRFENVRIEALGTLLPSEVVSSNDIEDRLAPLYDRLHLHTGRLELMSGIRERRFFAPGTRPSEVAARAGKLALEKSGIETAQIGCLIHSSVSRDFLEPATASVVHHTLDLPAEAPAFDLSNACLGFLNAMVVMAEMIERGSIDAGLVVAGEDGRPLVDTTIEALLDLDRDEQELRAILKRAFASLTIGSGAAAAVLCNAKLSAGGARLLGGIARADTRHHVLCHGDTEGRGLWMETDSEALLHAGNTLASRTFEGFRTELDWNRDSIDRYITHQVGVAHRRLLQKTLGLDPERDFPTVETLGNIGSVSLPLTLASAREAGHVTDGQRVALLGIGSGLQCLMLGIEVLGAPF